MASDNSTDKLLYLLKTRGPAETKALATALGITAMGARQHLQRLHGQSLVAREDVRRGVGRPAQCWRLTEAGHARFPDSHGELTVGLIEAVRGEFGEAGLERLIDARARQVEANYRAALASCETLEARLEALADLRTREGYMASWRAAAAGDGYWLVENHCPVCAAAKVCQGLCRSELALFQAVLGAGVTVSREDHILAGARRCAYWVVERGPA